MLDPIDILQPVTAPSEAMAGYCDKIREKHELVCSGSAALLRVLVGYRLMTTAPKLSCLSCGYRHELPVLRPVAGSRRWRRE